MLNFTMIAGATAIKHYITRRFKGRE